jgi:type II secretory pathway component PulJ
MELLYRDMLQESAQLVGLIEQLTARQEEISQAMQALPSTVRQAGMEAAANAGGRAARSLLEASRTLAKSTSEARIATRVATRALPAAAWRAGVLCGVCALIGSGIGAALLTLALH